MAMAHYFFAIVFLICGCTEPRAKEKITKKPFISDSLTISKEPAFYPLTKNHKETDTVSQYLSSFDFTNCESIEHFLSELYNRDQSYRDSLNSDWARDTEKRGVFTSKMSDVDQVNQEILRISLEPILQKLECIDKQIEIDALWLVAHHSNDNRLMKAVQPAVDVAHEHNIIRKDAYDLYYGKLNRIK